MSVIRTNPGPTPRDMEGQGKPKYERLRQFFVEEILAGRLKPGDMLPTEQRLADSYAIARSTVRQALAALERDGLIQRIQGKGTFIHEGAAVRSRPDLDVFALVLPEMQSGFYPSLQRSFDEAAGHVHNQMLVCQSNNSLDRQGNIILQLIDKEVAGVAIVPVTAPATPAYQIRQIQKAGIPVVFCHRRVEGVRAPLLAIPFREVGRLAGRALVERGHRRVAFFAPHRSEPSVGYLAGLLDVLPPGAHTAEHDVFFRGEDAFDPEIHEAEVLAALTALMSQGERPTAIFASFDSAAELIYLLLLRMGLRVPEDISLVGMGGTVRGSATLRRITSATVDEIQIGHRAVELLDRMRRHELPIDCNETFVMPIGLSDGQTLGPAPRGDRSSSSSPDDSPRAIDMQPRTAPSPHPWLLAALALAGVLGCSDAVDEGQNFFDPKALVPVGGVVTRNGEPLAGAVVMFLPKTGLPGVAETGEGGRYELKTIRSRGVLPGDYKVSISYLVSADGEPQGIAAREALFPSRAMVSAKEQLPPEYADVFRSTQTAKVTPRGGLAFHFDVKAAVPAAAKGAAPKAKDDAEAEEKTP